MIIELKRRKCYPCVILCSKMSPLIYPKHCDFNVINHLYEILIFQFQKQIRLIQKARKCPILSKFWLMFQHLKYKMGKILQLWKIIIVVGQQRLPVSICLGSNIENRINFIAIKMLDLSFPIHLQWLTLEDNVI